MHVIILRHAEKDLHGGSSDPGISPRGKQQAQALADLLKDKRWPTPDRVISSPKRRAQETVAPTVTALNLEAIIDHALNERQPDESVDAFRKRLRSVIHKVETATNKCTILCSHLDSIEELRAMFDCEQDLTGPEYEYWVPSHFLVLKLDDLWTVIGAGEAP